MTVFGEICGLVSRGYGLLYPYGSALYARTRKTAAPSRHGGSKTIDGRP